MAADQEARGEAKGRKIFNEEVEEEEKSKQQEGMKKNVSQALATPRRASKRVYVWVCVCVRARVCVPWPVTSCPSHTQQRVAPRAVKSTITVAAVL